MYEIAEKILNASDDHKQRIFDAAMWYVKQELYMLPLVKGKKILPPKDIGINYAHASKNKKTIEKWFHPEYGRFRGWNIGLACGKEEGIFAVDLDRHDEEPGKNGVKNWQTEIERAEYELPACPIQSTPSDGKHILFKWKEGGVSSTHKIAKGIDTRGGNRKSCKSHIVAFPSVVDGKMYEWDNWSDILPEVPDWIMEKLGRAWSSTISESSRGNEYVTDEDIEDVLELPQIKRMLTFIDPNECDYEKWLRVGMSIKSQIQGEEGLTLWDEWARRGEAYKEGECYIRWEGFSDLGSVRAGTLFYYSSEGGWEREEQEKFGNPFDELVARMNKEYAVVAIGGKIRILREIKPSFSMQMHFDLMEKDSFRTMLQNKKIVIGSGKKRKAVLECDIWLGHEGRRTYSNGPSLFPEGETPEGYYNTWRGFICEPIKGDCRLFLTHLKNVICNGNKENYEWLLDWLADLFQFPAHPKGCAVVMKSDEGTGKGVFANAIGEMFGPHHRHLIDESHLTSNFNAHLLDAITVFADEITWGGNKKTAGKLKGMVTEDILIGERKGIDGILYRSMIHILIASNSDWVIPAGSGSRRWFVLQVSERKIGDIAYFKAIVDEKENGGREALLYFLLNRKITRNLRTAPETMALNEQRIMNTQGDTIFHWWRRCLLKERINIKDLKDKDDDSSGWPAVVHKIDLYEEYESYVLNRKDRISIENVFAKRMIEYGIRLARPSIEGKRTRVYELPTIEGAIKILNRVMPGAILNEDDTSNSK